MNAKENFSIFRHWKTNGHVLFLILLQIVFIVLFALFVVYDPTAESSAIPKGTYYLKNEIDCSYILQDQIIKHKNGTESNIKTKVKNTYTSEQGQQILGNYPGKHLKVKVDGLVTLIKIILNSLNKFALTAGIRKLNTKISVKISYLFLIFISVFQDVHVMIFIGIGFLMTFLKKYGLSAVSLNMLIAVVCLQWGLLVYGWTHLHCGKIYFNLSRLKLLFLSKINLVLFSFFCFKKFLSMLGADFCAATVLISFGVLLGKTSPLQVIVMALIEIVLFIGNEIIGRKYFGVCIFLQFLILGIMFVVKPPLIFFTGH